MPISFSLKSHSTVLSIVLVLVVLMVATVFSRTAANEIAPIARTFGIIDKVGNWIVKPSYEQIIYVKSIDSYWVKEPRVPNTTSEHLRQVLALLVKNDAWKLLDKNGVKQNASLPYLVEPDMSVSCCSERIPVHGRDGLGLCDPFGKQLLKCLYSEIYDVGDGLLIAREAYRETPPVAFMHRFIGGLGGDMPVCPLKLFDYEGHELTTLPPTLFRPEGHFVNGLLKCDNASGGSPPFFIDRHGKVIAINPTSTGELKTDRASYRSMPFEHFVYEVPTSQKTQIHFEHEPVSGCDLKYADPKYAAPMALSTETAIACIKTRDGKYLSGIVDLTGKWLLPPVYDKLDSGSKHQFIAARSEN